MLLSLQHCISCIAYQICCGSLAILLLLLHHRLFAQPGLLPATSFEPCTTFSVIRCWDCCYCLVIVIAIVIAIVFVIAIVTVTVVVIAVVIVTVIGIVIVIVIVIAIVIAILIGIGNLTWGFDPPHSWHILYTQQCVRNHAETAQEAGAA